MVMDPRYAHTILNHSSNTGRTERKYDEGEIDSKIIVVPSGKWGSAETNDQGIGYMGSFSVNCIAFALVARDPKTGHCRAALANAEHFATIHTLSDEILRDLDAPDDWNKSAFIVAPYANTSHEFVLLDEMNTRGIPVYMDSGQDKFAAIVNLSQGRMTNPGMAHITSSTTNSLPKFLASGKDFALEQGRVEEFRQNERKGHLKLAEFVTGGKAITSFAGSGQFDLVQHFRHRQGVVLSNMPQMDNKDFFIQYL